MFWSRKPNFEQLVARYLNPTGRWTTTDDTSMREEIRHSEESRSLYDRRIIAHRLMLGLDENTPSAIEKERLMSSTLELSLKAQITETAVAWWRSPALSGAVGLAAALLVAVYVGGIFDVEPHAPGIVPPPPGTSAEYLATRGGEIKDIRGGIGVSGQTEGGERSYEVLRSDGAFLNDQVRFSYQCSDPSLGYLFLFGLQADARENDGWTTHWYYPKGTPSEAQSIAVTCGKDTERAELPGATDLSVRHLEGAIAVVAIYTREPIQFADATASLTTFEPQPYLENLERKALTPEFLDYVHSTLDLDRHAVVAAISFGINEGTKGAIDAR